MFGITVSCPSIPQRPDAESQSGTGLIPAVLTVRSDRIVFLISIKFDLLKLVLHTLQISRVTLSVYVPKHSCGGKQSIRAVRVEIFRIETVCRLMVLQV